MILYSSLVYKSNLVRKVNEATPVLHFPKGGAYITSQLDPFTATVKVLVASLQFHHHLRELHLYRYRGEP